jgi:hypothetical protein
MVKHLIELTVKYGEAQAFFDAVREWQKLAADAGLESYTVWANDRAGRMNEVFFEADFPTHDALQVRDAAEENNPERFRSVTARMLGHVVPGSVIDRRIDQMT